MNCIICNTLLSGRQTKYCNPRCWIKGWKISNRESYLAGKKRYREKNKDKLLAYNREKRKNETPEHIRRVFKKNHLICSRCGCKNKLNIHHIKPVRFGGSHNSDNLIMFCWDCHMLWHKLLGEFWDVDKHIYPPLSKEVSISESPTEN